MQVFQLSKLRRLGTKGVLAGRQARPCDAAASTPSVNDNGCRSNAFSRASVTRPGRPAQRRAPIAVPKACRSASQGSEQVYGPSSRRATSRIGSEPIVRLMTPLESSPTSDVPACAAEPGHRSHDASAVGEAQVLDATMRADQHDIIIAALKRAHRDSWHSMHARRNTASRSHWW